MSRWLFVLILFVRAAFGQAQDGRGLIFGYIFDFKNPLAGAEVQAIRQSGTATRVAVAITAQNGSYRLWDLPPGAYNLRVRATEFYSTEIRSVAVHKGRTTLLPVVRLDFGFFDCAADPRPAYYRPLASSDRRGAVGGVVTSEKQQPLGDASVTLYEQGKGKISSQTTRHDGTFFFDGLEARARQYWVSISREGSFTEEVEHLTVLQGLESVYSPITTESCSPGRCQPQLKTIRVLPQCE